MTALATFVVVAAAVTFLDAAAASTDPPVDYTITTDGLFQEGCFDPCDCLLADFDLRGTFLLVPAGEDGGFALFDVRAVHWWIGVGDASADSSVSGSGTFRIGRDPALGQRLELDLSTGGSAPAHFDSGLVPVEATFPRLRVAVAMNGFYCYDRVFLVEAAPETSGTPTRTTSWARLKMVSSR